VAKKFYSGIRVIYADTDAMGIAYHGNYAKWFEIGRTEFLRQIGYPYATLEKEGIWLPVVELVIKYKQPALYDDILSIACWADDLRGASVIMRYEVKRKVSGELLVDGYTKHAITDPDLKPMLLKRTKPEFYNDVAATIEDE
jgi:acyl-CoA thioester hydrolase